MSTRCLIGLYNPKDNTVTSMYCHSDGYTTCTGAILLTDYDTEDKVKELLNLGSLSSLPQYEELKHTNIVDEAPQKNTLIDFLYKNRDISYEYLYIFDPSKKEWFVNSRHHPFLENESFWKIHNLSDSYWDLFKDKNSGKIVKELRYFIYETKSYKNSKFSKIQNEFLPLKNLLAFELKNEMIYAFNKAKEAKQINNSSSLLNYDSWMNSYNSNKELFSELSSKNLINIKTFMNAERLKEQFLEDSKTAIDEIYDNLVQEYNRIYDYKSSHKLPAMGLDDFIDLIKPKLCNDFEISKLPQGEYSSNYSDYVINSKVTLPINIVYDKINNILKEYYEHNSENIQKILKGETIDQFYPCDDVYSCLGSNVLPEIPCIDNDLLYGLCLCGTQKTEFNPYNCIYSVLRNTDDPDIKYLVLGGNVDEVDSVDYFNKTVKDKKLLLSLLVVNEKEKQIGIDYKTINELLHSGVSCEYKADKKSFESDPFKIKDFILKDNINLEEYACTDAKTENLVHSIVAVNSSLGKEVEMILDSSIKVL